MLCSSVLGPRPSRCMQLLRRSSCPLPLLLPHLPRFARTQHPHAGAGSRQSLRDSLRVRRTPRPSIRTTHGRLLQGHSAHAELPSTTSSYSLFTFYLLSHLLCLCHTLSVYTHTQPSTSPDINCRPIHRICLAQHLTSPSLVLFSLPVLANHTLLASAYSPSSQRPAHHPVRESHTDPFPSRLCSRDNTHNPSVAFLGLLDLSPHSSWD